MFKSHQGAPCLSTKSCHTNSLHYYLCRFSPKRLTYDQMARDGNKLNTQTHAIGVAG